MPPNKRLQAASRFFVGALRAHYLIRLQLNPNGWADKER